MEKNYCVYKHTAPNGKVYIGITCRKPEIRWARGKGYHHNDHFQKAINKYGWDNFEHEILYEHLTKEEACEYEIRLIAYYKSNSREFGYNQSTGGENPCSGYKMTKEQREAISKRMKGRHLSDEQKEKLRQTRIGSVPWNKGKHLSEEHKIKLKENHKGNLGKTQSKETREKISKANIDKNGKRVMCVETGEIFETASTAARKININMGGIVGCCNNKKHYNTAGGFHWAYVDCEAKYEKTQPKPKFKRVAQIQNGEVINIYASAMEAARTLKVCHSNIYRCCKGERATAYGYNGSGYNI